MAGDNDAQVLRGKNHSVNCLAWALTGIATEGMLTMHFEEVLILWRGQNKIIPEIRVSKAIMWDLVVSALCWQDMKDFQDNSVPHF